MAHEVDRAGHALPHPWRLWGFLALAAAATLWGYLRPEVYPGAWPVALATAIGLAVLLVLHYRGSLPLS